MFHVSAIAFAAPQTDELGFGDSINFMKTELLTNAYQEELRLTAQNNQSSKSFNQFTSK